LPRKPGEVRQFLLTHPNAQRAGERLHAVAQGGKVAGARSMISKSAAF